MLDPESKTFVVYVASLSFNASPSSSPLDVNPIAGLIAKEALTKASDKYVDFANMLSPDFTLELPEYTGINNHSIELVNSQQPSYGPIYNLRLVDPERLHWDQSSQRARQTIQVTRRCSYSFRPEVGQVTSVVCRSKLPKHTSINNHSINLSP